MNNVDIIGLIYEPTGNTLTDEEGFEYPELAPIDGFHVNTLEPIPDADEYICTVHSPIRLYAGIPPEKHYFYCFPDEETFREFVPLPPEPEDYL